MIARDWRARQELILMERRAASGLALYREVGASFAEPMTRLAALEALGACVRDLGLPAETCIRWFMPDAEAGTSSLGKSFEDRDTLLGKVEPKNHTELWIKASASLEAVRETVCHEARHAWQFQRYFAEGGPFEMEHGSKGLYIEGDADEYAAMMVQRLTTPTPLPTRKEPAMLRPATYRSAPSPLAPRRETWSHKGVTYVACDSCDEGVPVNTTHRCPAAGWPGAYAPRTSGRKYDSRGYLVKAL